MQVLAAIRIRMVLCRDRLALKAGLRGPVKSIAIICVENHIDAGLSASALFPVPIPPMSLQFFVGIPNGRDGNIGGAILLK